MFTEIEPTPWLEYDWHYAGESALFGVDLTISSTAPDKSLPVLLCVRLAHKKHEILTGGDIKRCESFMNRCTRSLGFTYVGFVQTKGWVQYYFYVESHQALDDAEKLSGRLHGFAARCDVKDDPMWRIYFTQLYPNAAKMQTEYNRRTIEFYEENGDVIKARRRLELHMYFASDPIRMLFEEDARLAGFAIGKPDFQSEYELPHGTTIYKISSLKKNEVDEVTTLAIRIARRHEGVLMNWDCPKMSGVSR